MAVLELRLQLTVPRGASVTEPRTPTTRAVELTATARPNEPTLARVVWDPASRRSLLLLMRVFEVHGEADLRAIFECKMQEHQRAQRRRAGRL